MPPLLHNPMGTDSREKIQVRWTGAAGLEITKDQQTVLIDPYHSRLGKREVFFKPLVPRLHAIEKYLETLPGELSAVIVGHTHFDDFSGPMDANMDAPALLFQDMKGFLSRISQSAPRAEIRVPRTFESMFF